MAPSEGGRERVWSDAGGYVRGFCPELPETARLPPEIWRELDPVFQWVLHGVHEALLPVGHCGDSSRVGLILGNLSFPSRAMAQYAWGVWLDALAGRLDGHARELARVPNVAAQNRFMSSGPAALAATALGLGAGSLTLDAACASALYALKVACDWLHERRADVMVAGAVNGSDSLFIHMGFSALSAISRTGQSRPFDQRADGLVPAEGAGFLTLKRLEDAVACGDNVLGVIRGIGLSNDGRGRGLLVPSADGQLRAMRQAYEVSGLTPDDIQFVECHATGTALGDATELRSMKELFGARRSVPIGSLKSNLGHLITAAGVGGALKALAGMASGLLPPMPEVEQPIDELARGPFRVVSTAEQWPDVPVRRVAVNAFGFGGNNAHLLLEQWTGRDATASRKHPVPASIREDIAVVGSCALLGDDREHSDFVQRVFAPPAAPARRDSIAVELPGLRFPPNDIQQTLPQQLLVLEAARKAVRGLTLPRDRSGVFIGMETDPEVARYGVRWQVETWAQRWSEALGMSLDDAWLREARQNSQDRLGSAGVIGTMPNIVANRINSQLDLAGASMTTSTGALSGIAGLEVAVAALRRGELDAAVVGAVDLSDDRVHRAARCELGHQGPVADGAAVLVLKRLVDARRDGDRVLAVLCDEPPSLHLGPGAPGGDPLAAHGEAFAAAGLLQVAAGIIAVQHGVKASARTHRQPWFGRRTASVNARTANGERARVAFRAAGPPEPFPPARAPQFRVVTGADRADVLRNLDAERSPGDGAARLVWIDYGDRESSLRQMRARHFVAHGGDLPEGVAYCDRPLAGDVAFVFTGAAAAYAGMGSDFLVAMPDAYDGFVQQLGDDGVAAEALARGFSVPTHPLDQLWASSLLCQAHAYLSRKVLGIEPDAIIGYSSGETNGLFAMGAWRDLGEMFSQTMAEDLLRTELAGPFHAAERAWRKLGWRGKEAAFRAYAVPQGEAAVAAAVADEPLVHLTIVNSPAECVIGGEAVACERVLRRLGAASAIAIPYKLVAHSPAVAEARTAWTALHSRATWQTPGVRYYWNGFGEARAISQATVAEAITQQAVQTLHFPRIVERAYADGVRVFVEHGPQGLCSKWISRILGDREHLAVALDSTQRGAIDQIAWTTAQLLAAGCRVAPEQLVARLSGNRCATRPAQAIEFPAHRKPFRLPRIDGETQRLPAAPALPPVLESGLFDRSPPPPAHAGPSAATDPPRTEPASAGPARACAPRARSASRISVASPALGPSAATIAAVAGPVAASGAAMGAVAMTGTPTRRAARAARVQAHVFGAHQEFLLAQAEAQQQCLALQQRLTGGFLARAAERMRAPLAQEPARKRKPSIPPRVQARVSSSHKPATPTDNTEHAARPSANGTSVARPVLVESPPQPRSARPDSAVTPGTPIGPTFSRAELLVHASGQISSVFGPEFAHQDAYARQVRMPEPPLLLVDRVMGIQGAPGSMGTGTIWTETSVVDDAWYMQDGRMPASIMIESGQADLMLISWLGIDRYNRGERVYRLLGCELTYHSELPRAGDTLRYEIHIDGHAQQGDTRLFFFHYDCWVGQRRALSVRGGQAGFFSYAELAESAGVLWDPAEDDRPITGPRADAAVACTRSAFDKTAVRAFSEGRVFDCFGPGFELAQTHVDPPRIAAGRMLLLDRVTDLDPDGGPWKRGYLRAELDIDPQAWFFDGHFKNDPCMPGTLMFEGCLQTMAFFLTSLGFTIERDGYQFEPATEHASTMRCRGQVSPTSKRLIYELFVEEVRDGAIPSLRADLLCTVDGLKAFHARSFGVELRPGWPLSRWKVEPAFEQARGGGRPFSLRKLGGLADYVESKPVASHEGFEFGYGSLLACAWGRPTTAFGPFYQRFDGPRRVARLPGPPYHFATRVREVDATMGEMKSGSLVEIEYDIPEHVWYFDDNGAPTMPLCVVMEASLQPCGWLASYIGSTLATDTDLMFRNLDGTATLHEEIVPSSGTLRTRSRIGNISRSGTMIIESFRVECFVDDRLVYEMDTVFGFFPKEAFENQAGLPVGEEEQARIEQPGGVDLDLRPRPARYFTGSPRIAGGMLCMLDCISDFQPDGGRQGLGWARGEKAVDPGEWFFKAHFFQDPVQPGSLGVEAMCQLLQFVMIEKGLAAGIEHPSFEPLALGRALRWKYRGQVVPRNQRITTEVEITEIGRDSRGSFAVADAALWVDGKRIYQATGLAMRIRPGEPPVRSAIEPTRSEETLDPAVDRWLQDHCPTWTVPALPLMSMIDRLASAAHTATGRDVVALRDVQVRRWLTFPGGPVRLQTEVGPAGDDVEVRLSAWRRAKTAEMSRFEIVADGRVVLRSGGQEAAPEPLPMLAGGEVITAPYETGTLFHGRSFQLLRSLRLTQTGASAELDVGADGVPPGHLRQGLLDALTHAIPHDALWRWSERIARGQVAYPYRIRELRLLGELPRTGSARVEVRFAGFDGDERFPMCDIQLLVQDDVRLSLRLVEILLPTGPIGAAAPAERRAFLRDRSFVRGVGLSTVRADATSLDRSIVRASNWLPGNVARIYGCQDGPRLAEHVAVKDHIAHMAQVHPATIDVSGDERSATTPHYPLNRFHVELRTPDKERIEVATSARESLDLEPVKQFWRGHFALGAWPVEDLYYALVERFLGRVVLADPAGFESMKGRGALYLANHQVGIESLLFSIVMPALSRSITQTLAKREHRQSWLGGLIRRCFSYPGVHDPGTISFFDRNDPADLPRIMQALGRDLSVHGRSTMVHVEGTRALQCRQPIEKLSSTVLDMALAVGCPIVPVRFAGGLPVAPLRSRLEFPVGFCRQDVYVGQALSPEALREQPLKERRQTVLDALNRIGPDLLEEVPNPPSPEIEAKVEAWSTSTGALPADAALLVALMQHAPESELIQRLLHGVESGRLALGGAPDERWLAPLAAQLYGPRGPIIVEPK